MTKSESEEDSLQDLRESGEGLEIPPGLAVLIAIIAAFVLLVIIMIVFYWIRKLHGEKSQVDLESDYNSSFQHMGIPMSGYKKTASQVIMITAPGGETFQADQDGDNDYDFRDFLSVKDVDISRYKSSQDVVSLNTFKSCSSVDNSLSLCSEMTDNSRECQQEQESVNPTPAIKINFEKENKGIPSGKDTLPSSLPPNIRGNETIERGAEFWSKYWSVL